MKTLCDECETAYLNNCECEEPCTHKEYYDEGYEQGKSDRQDEIINLIQEMQESAEANMMFKHADACERIIAAIKREQSNE